MKLRNTILLFLAAGLLLAFIILVERENLTTAGKLRKDSLLAMFRPDNINVVELENSGADIRLTYRDNRWKVREPFDDYADPDAVKEVIETLANIEVIRKEHIEDGNIRRDLGLDTDKQSVLLKGDGPQVFIIFGLETPSGEGVYARVKPGKEFAQIKKEVRDKVLREPDQFRDPFLARFEPKDVVDIRVRRPDGDLGLELKDGFWQFRKPLQAPADNQAVFDSLTKLATTKIEKFVANTQETAAQYGLTDPEGFIHLGLKNGEKVVVKLGGETPDKKHVYVSVAGRPGIFQMPDSVRAFVTLPPDQWRERRVLRMPLEALTRVEVQAEGHPATVLEYADYAWRLDVDGQKTPAQQSYVADLVKWLSSARVEEFVSSGKTKRAEFGLVQPRLRIRFKAMSPKEMEKRRLGVPPVPGEVQDKDWPEEAELLFGKEENGLVYLETPFQTAVVTVPAAPMADLPKEPYQWRSLLLQAIAEEQFEWIEYQPANQPSQRYDRQSNGSWKPAEGARAGVGGFVREASESLGKLRALQYVAPRPAPEHGFDKPVMAIDFRLRGEPRTLRLEVGAPDGTRGHFARLQGLDAVFLLSAPDFEVLTLPLHVAPAPLATGADPQSSRN